MKWGVTLSDTYILTSNGVFLSEDELAHHGILGMKWGVRRYQNADGTLTAEGGAPVYQSHDA